MSEQQGEGRRYEVRELLGQGGFGSVYRADLIGQGGFSKPVALKILNADMEGLEDVARRLRDEARMLGLIRHRAIVQVDGLVMLDGRWTIVMEFVEGVDLRSLIETGPCPSGPALEIVQEVAAALHVAYDRPAPSGEVLKLLHRDIKPGNIQLTAAGEVKVLDFGIARAEFGGREAETRSVMYGSVPYMSPERLDFEDSHKGDIYALGIVLYELLTGESLGKTSANEKRHAELVAKAKITLEAHRVGAEIIAFLLGTLAFEPDDRPSAKEFERAARQLRAKYPDPSLSELAEERVVPLLGKRVPRNDGLSGQVLNESTSLRLRKDSAPTDAETTWQRNDKKAPPPAARPSAPGTTGPVATSTSIAAPAPSSRSAFGIGVAIVALIMVLGGAALVTVVAVGAVVASSGSASKTNPPVAEAVAAMVPPPKEAAAPDPVLPPDAIPEAAAKADPAPAAKPTPKAPSAKVMSKPVVPATTAPPLSAPTTGTVEFAGDATAVTLIAPGATLSAGVVPAGSYRIQASFPSKGFVDAGMVEVKAGATVHLRCMEAFLRCQVK
jgi:serine/threonine protein kinase